MSVAGCCVLVRWGIIPDMSATVTLRELVPKDVAMELMMTGRIFDALEAQRLGLVTRIADDPLAEALRLADEIATRSPDATAAAKRLVHATFSDGCSEGRALGIEQQLQTRLIGGWNQLACAAKGLGVPHLLQPSFRLRSDEWSAEADGEAEAEIVAMLDGMDAADATPQAVHGAAD